MRISKRTSTDWTGDDMDWRNEDFASPCPSRDTDAGRLAWQAERAAWAVWTVSVILACDAKDALIARLNAEIADAQPEPVQVVKAERDAALDAALDLLKILRRDGGYRTARQQATIRGVVALLAEHGRRVGKEEPGQWEDRQVGT